MPIKLLQHKSWHVYSQENVARVKRDEALAAAQEDEQNQRTMLADSEARIDRMKHKKRKVKDRDDEGENDLERQLKGKKRNDAEKETSTRDERRVDDKGKGRGVEQNDDKMMSGGHLNFWAHLEGTNGAGPSAANLEKRIEKASAKSTKESELDALTKVYLAKKGEGEPKGWYASEDGKTERERKEGEEATLERAYRDNETKRLVDPLALMNSYLKRRDDIRSGNLDQSTRRVPSTRDRYIEPTTSSRYSETPRSERSSRYREDDLEPVVEKLLGERRRRGDPLPPPPVPTRSTRPPPPSLTSNSQDPESEAQRRVSAERARTAALLAAKRRAALSSSASSVASTPRSEYGAQEGGFGMFNREEVREARRERASGWGERKERRGERERESREGWGRR